jgi:hypothetical protein
MLRLEIALASLSFSAEQFVRIVGTGVLGLPAACFEAGGIAAAAQADG